MLLHVHKATLVASISHIGRRILAWRTLASSSKDLLAIEVMYLSESSELSRCSSEWFQVIETKLSALAVGADRATTSR